MSNYNYNNSTSAQANGMGIVSVLTIVFIILKITGIIAWSWWWVFSPLWISLAISLGLIIICYMSLFIIDSIKKIIKKTKEKK